MKKKQNNRMLAIVYILFLLLCPVLFTLAGSALSLTGSFDYNKSLIRNISANLSNDNQRLLLTFDDNNRTNLKEWDNYSNVFNRDFYGSNNLIRTSKSSFEMTTFDDIKSQVLISDICQCSIPNNEKWSYSDLLISTSMADFKEDSLFVSDELAASLSLELGKKVLITADKKPYLLTVIGIYSRYAGKYLNNTYFEFGLPLCFVSKNVFNSISGNQFNSYLKLSNNKTLLESCCIEIEPFLSINGSLLTVAEGFSINDFTICGKTLRQYQTDLLEIYNKKNGGAIYYLCIVFTILFFIVSCFACYSLISQLVGDIKFIHSHIILANFLYSLFVAGISILSAFILRNYFSVINLNSYVLYRPFKFSLILIAAFSIIYIFITIISSIIKHRKKSAENNLIRQQEIKDLNTNKNKLIFVTGSLTRGGAEKVIVELANYYASLGRKVDIVILLNNTVEWDLHKNINVVNFTGDTQSRIKRIGYWLKNLKKYFNDNPKTTIVSFLVRVNILVLLSTKRKNHQIIISERNDPRYDGRGIIVNSFVNSLYPKCDKIVFQTENCKKLFSRDIQDKGVVIANPIQIKKYASLTDYKKHYFVSAGRITEQKDQLTMVRAMKNVVKEFPDAVLEIYGDGNLTDSLKKTISSLKLQNNVFVYPNTKDINEKIVSSSLYICTSLYEGMSNSLMEASFAGVPCITTKCLGTDFIKEQKNGFFIDFMAPRELADIILGLLRDQKRYTQLRKESIQIAKELEHDDIYLKWKKCINNE